MKTIHLNRAQIQRLKFYFPAILNNYKKWRLNIYIADNVDVGSCWDGGSRAEYSLFNNNGRLVKPVTKDAYAAQKNQEDTTYTLKEDEIIVETGTFCGKPATMTWWLREESWEKIEKGILNHNE